MSICYIFLFEVLIILKPKKYIVAFFKYFDNITILLYCSAFDCNKIPKNS